MKEKEFIKKIQKGLTNFDLPYLHINNTNTPNCGTLYAQDIEPAGKYISYNDHKYIIPAPNYEYSFAHIKKPLVLEFISTTHGGWKTTLSNMYNGKIGKKLSKAILADGYDSVLTIDTKNQNIMEIVLLKH